jgi:hypothetical protein
MMQAYGPRSKEVRILITIAVITVVGLLHMKVMTREIPTMKGQANQNNKTGKYKDLDLAKYAAAFREKGGVFIFLHVPKTGGSTVRDFVKKQAVNKSLYMETHGGEVPWQRAKRAIDRYVVEGTNGTAVFMEDHVHPNPVRILFPQLKQWREIAQANGVPFFAFTMHREPLSFSVSFFNYFWVQNRRVNGTLENFHKHLSHNPQCDYLVQGASRGGRDMKNASQCFTGYDEMFEVMDWISPTPTFDKEILPLVAYLANLQYRDLGHVNDVKKPALSLKTMPESSIERIRNMTWLDQELYDRILKTYVFDDWREYLESQGAMIPCKWSYKENLCEYPDGTKLPTGEIPTQIMLSGLKRQQHITLS